MHALAVPHVYESSTIGDGDDNTYTTASPPVSNAGMHLCSMGKSLFSLWHGGPSCVRRVVVLGGFSWLSLVGVFFAGCWYPPWYWYHLLVWCAE